MKHVHLFSGSRRHRNPLPATVIRIVVFAFIVVMAIRVFRSDNQPAGSSPPSGSGSATAVEPDRYPLSAVREQLAAAPVSEARQGIALAVLLDCSGSMNESAGGQRKIDAAKSAVRELVETTARIAGEKTDTPILLGLYAFSSGSRDPVREVIAMGPPNAASAQAAIASMRANGGTPIGDAIIAAKRDLDATGMYRQHILVVTDGENTAGPNPQTVLMAMNELQERPPAAIYFVAFDIGADIFDPVKNAGGVVLPAANPGQLRQTLDELLTGRIMVE